MTEEEINFAIEKCIEQFPFFPAQNIPFTKFADFLYNNTIEDPEISINFVDKLHIYKMIYNIALIRNKQEIVLRIYNVISDNIWLWDDKIFKSWYGNKINYLRGLKDYESNRISLQNNINMNLAEPKIAKLPKMSFLEQCILNLLKTRKNEKMALHTYPYIVALSNVAQTIFAPLQLFTRKQQKFYC